MKTITHLKSKINELNKTRLWETIWDAGKDRALSPSFQTLLWFCTEADRNWHCLSTVKPRARGTDLKHLPDLPAGQVNVEFMHQLVDLFNVQQAVSVLVSLLKGLFHPAANTSRKRTRVWSPPGGGRQSSWAGRGQDFSSGNETRPQLFWAGGWNSLAEHLNIC